MKGDMRKEIRRNKIRNSNSRIDNRILSDIKVLRIQLQYYPEYMEFWVVPRGKAPHTVGDLRFTPPVQVCTGYNMYCTGLFIFITQRILLLPHFLPLLLTFFDVRLLPQSSHSVIFG